MSESKIGSEIRILNNLIRRKVCNCVQEVCGKAIGTQSFIVKFLYENQDKEIYQKDIEKEFKIRRSTVTSSLKKMEDAGLITRISVEKDSRLKRIIITEKAKEIHNRIVERINEIDKSIGETLTESEKETFLTIIKKMQENLE